VERAITAELERWLGGRRRKPLVLRGARQVGKTWLARDLARRAGRELVELNFEREPRLAHAFASNDPPTIVGELSLIVGRDVHADRFMLFLDEIQQARELLGRLRWFAEELPQLPVLAAGSLLDFALAHPAGSVPVGRLSFLHVEPLGFPEYLRAHGQHPLLAALEAWHPRARQPFPATLHDRATALWQRFAMVGGMPAVVAADVNGASARECRDMQRDLVATYRADFAKYAGRMDPRVLDSVLHAVAGALGRKFVYAHVGDGVKQHQAKRGLELLAAARLVHLVRYSAANGLPLGGETKDTFRKAMLVDVGVFHGLAGTPAGTRFPRLASLAPAIRSQLADQLVAQSLRIGGDVTGEGPELFYWQRDGGRPGEIDYLLQAGGAIVPVELKSGSSGAMKSLHQFMHDKHLALALRFDDNPPSLATIAVKTTQGDPVRYRLLGLPHYLAYRAAKLVEALV
jgi:uncharacterized protein